MPSEAIAAIVWITGSRTLIASAKKYSSKSWTIRIDVAVEAFTCHKHGYITSSLNSQNKIKNVAKHISTFKHKYRNANHNAAHLTLQSWLSSALAHRTDRLIALDIRANSVCPARVKWSWDPANTIAIFDTWAPPIDRFFPVTCTIRDSGVFGVEEKNQASFECVKETQTFDQRICRGILATTKFTTEFVKTFIKVLKLLNRFQKQRLDNVCDICTSTLTKQKACNFWEASQHDFISFWFVW